MSTTPPEIAAIRDAQRRMFAARVDSSAPSELRLAFEQAEFTFELMCHRHMTAVLSHIDSVTAERDAAIARAEAAEKDSARLRAFAEAVMGDWPDVGGLDGFDLQVLGTKHGLLEMQQRIAPCREETCRCAEYDTGPVECYTITDLLRPAAALAAKGETT